MDFGNGIEVRVEETDGARVVYALGEIRLPGAATLRQALNEALEPGCVTRLDLAGVTAIDLCGLQLLCAAHRTYARSQSGFELRAVPEEIRRTARAAGYDAGTSVCPFRRGDTCLWNG